MRRVLLVDTNFSSAPIYNSLVRSGYEVFVVGANPNDFLAKSVKNYIDANYSNVEQTRKIAEKMAIDFIVPGCNDRSYHVCAELNSEGRFFGLDTLETTKIINEKDKFRAFAKEIGLAVPQVLAVEDVDETLPVVVKPVDAYSGHGMTVLKHPERQGLLSAIDLAKEYSRSKTYIIEEYVEGQLYSHSAFIRKGTIAADFIVEEHGTANPFVVDTSRVIYDFPPTMLSRIREEIVLMARKLNLVDGLVHTQFISNGESFWLIEVTRRCPGDLYGELINLSTGFNYAEAYATPFVGKDSSFDGAATTTSWIMRHTVSQPAEGVLGSIQFRFPVLIEKMIPISLAGDTIKASPFSRIALLFTRSNSEEELLTLYRETLGRRLYTIHQTN